MAEIEEDEVPIQIPTRVVRSTDIISISREQMKANRRELKRYNLLERIPRMTKDTPIYGRAKVPTLGGGHTLAYTINGHAMLAAQKRKEARSKPVVIAASSQPTATTGTKPKGIQGSFLKHPLDESADSLLDNPIPAAGSALEIGTEAKEKGGSVPNEDVGESSEIVVETLNPGADSSALDVASLGAQAEVKGGSVLKRPAADPSANVGTQDEMEGGSVLKRACVNLGESSELVAGNLNPAATGTVANVKGGSVLNKDLGESK